MNKIGFKNFRKFQELDPLDLSPITFFVGENNAGKSTVVKAMLSSLDFLRTRISQTDTDSWMNLNFYFNKSYYTHLGTFDRARYNKALDNSPISFTIAVGDRLYEIDVMKSDSESDVFGRVSRIRIVMLPFNIDITFSLRTDRTIKVVFHANPYPGYIMLDDLPFLPKRIEGYFKEMEEDIEIDMSIIQEPNTTLISEYTINALLHNVFSQLQATIKNISSPSREPNKSGIFGLNEDIKQFLSKNKTFIESLYAFFYRQSIINVEYIYAHAVTQTVLFSAKDTNDYHVKTIHEFASLQIGLGSPANDFILTWMEKFNIGLDFKIKSVGGEAHIVQIQNLDGEWVNLADKGMGSIQLMILLFRIATKMTEAGIGFGGTNVDTLLIIEEPEQNLHPMLQSKLADFFFELHKDYGFRFIVETHSEYLIRKSQVIVGAANKDNAEFENPFKVYYFPSDGNPYDLPYAKSGRFEEQFGTGFFDEATKWNREILRNENAK